MFTYHDKSAIRLPDKPRAEDMMALGPSYASDDPRNNGESRYGLVVLDEFGTWLNSREWNDKERRKLIDWFLHARKHRWDIIFLIQDIELCDAQIVWVLCEHLVVCRRMDRFKITGFGFPCFHVANVYYGRSTEVKVDRRWT
ncbi:Zonular occludens toxin (Zot) [compost metagenome]